MHQIISIGIKVLAAVGVGAAVYLGLDKAISTNNKVNNNNNNPNPNPSQPENSCNPNQQNNRGMQPCGRPVEMRTEDKIVNGLKTAQDVCGRAFSLCQNLATAAENIVRIFGKGNNYSGGYYNTCCGPNNGYHDRYGDPPGFRRISPYILEFVGDNNGGNCGYYNNQNQNYNNNGGY